MSVRAKKARKRLRARMRALRADPVIELTYLEELRAFVASEIPSLDSTDPWTPRQFAAIDGIYRMHLADSHWRCWHPGCDRPVNRFGEHCIEHEWQGKEMGPVDWDSVCV